MANLKEITKSELKKEVDVFIDICKRYEGNIFIYFEDEYYNNPEICYDYTEDYNKYINYFAGLIYLGDREPEIIWDNERRIIWGDEQMAVWYNKERISKEELVNRLFKIIEADYQQNF